MFVDTNAQLQQPMLSSLTSMKNKCKTSAFQLIPMQNQCKTNAISLIPMQNQCKASVCFVDKILKTLGKLRFCVGSNGTHEEKTDLQLEPMEQTWFRANTKTPNRIPILISKKTIPKSSHINKIFIWFETHTKTHKQIPILIWMKTLPK